MKKIIATVLAGAVLLSVSVVAMATETDWLLLVKASTVGNLSAGAIGQFGTKTGALDTFELTGDTATAGSATNPNVVSYHPEGGTYVANPPVYTGDKRAPIGTPTSTSVDQYWTLLAWVPSTWSSDFKIIGYSSSATTAPLANIKGANFKYSIYVDYDPSGKYTGQTLNIDPAKANPSSTNPYFTMTWTAAEAVSLRAANATAATGENGALKMTFRAVPEPSSIVAMLSGLVGMAGMAIRRKK